MNRVIQCASQVHIQRDQNFNLDRFNRANERTSERTNERACVRACVCVCVFHVIIFVSYIARTHHFYPLVYCSMANYALLHMKINIQLE